MVPLPSSRCLVPLRTRLEHHQVKSLHSHPPATSAPIPPSTVSPAPTAHNTSNTCQAQPQPCLIRSASPVPPTNIPTAAPPSGSGSASHTASASSGQFAPATAPIPRHRRHSSAQIRSYLLPSTRPDGSVHRHLPRQPGVEVPQ